MKKDTSAYNERGRSRLEKYTAHWLIHGPMLLKAFEDYVNSTVENYGHSRMFDCGIDKAEKIIAKCKKVK